jgi:hypothetical protein
MTDDKRLEIRQACRELASSNIVVDALARFLEQVITEVVENVKGRNSEQSKHS